jgi:prepilin peptidase CpaA
MIHALQTAVLLVFPALVIVGAVTDLTSYRIPNSISLALALAFAAAAGVALASGMALSAVGLDLVVGAGALIVGIAMFALRWIGGGDAKLFASAALWLGWPALPTYLVMTALAGGGLALLLMFLRSSPVRPLVPAGPAWFVRLVEPGESVPYGVAIAIGALAAFPGSALVRTVWGV